MPDARLSHRLRAWLLSRGFAVGMIAVGGAIWLLMTVVTFNLIAH